MKILLVIALAALITSTLIDSMAAPSKAHDIKDNVICESCHQDIVTEFKQTIEPYPTHLSKYSCKTCHESTSVHSAKIKVCIDCHQPDKHTQTYTICSDCHQPHGGQLPGITHGNGNGCKTCHNIRR